MCSEVELYSSLEEKHGLFSNPPAPTSPRKAGSAAITGGVQKFVVGSQDSPTTDVQLQEEILVSECLYLGMICEVIRRPKVLGSPNQ